MKLTSTWSGIARVVAWLAVAAIVAWLLSMTLRTSDQVKIGRLRFGAPTSEVNLRPVAPPAAGTYLTMDLIGNFAVFVPFGLALATATLPVQRGKRRHGLWLWFLGVTVAGTLLSLFIEIAQLAIPSRVSDVEDVILNTLGTVAGLLVVWCLLRLLKRR